MKFKEYINGPDDKPDEPTDKLAVQQWIDELTDGQGIDNDKVYIIVGSFINKLKK